MSDILPVEDHEISQSLLKSFKQQGIECRLNTRVDEINPEQDMVKLSISSNGKTEILESESLLLAIGVVPNLEGALSNEINLDFSNDYLWVDQNYQTSEPNIFAAGDCVSFPFNKDLIRLENVGNAIEQSEAASENVLGKDIKYQPVPWFWSDQFDIKLQIAGLNKGFTKVFHRQSDQKNSFWYYKDDQLISVEAINDPKSYMVGKKLLEMKKTPSPKDIVSNKINLKDMLREIK